MAKKLKRIVVGNWKMNPRTLDEAKRIAGAVRRSARTFRKTEIVLAVPYVYLPALSKGASNIVMLGAQDAHFEPTGSFTGEVSFAQLSDFKVSHVIVGHSERRALGDTDEIINKKVRAVTDEGMTAILCVGEKKRDQQGEYLSFVRGQIMTALRDVSKKLLDHVVIAYEPVWLIGGRDALAPRDVHEMAIFIKKVLRETWGVLGDSVRILYGASVTPLSASEIVSDGFVHGLLVGHESLKAQNFIEIAKEVEKTISK